LESKERINEAVYYFLRAHMLKKDDILTLVTISNFYISINEYKNAIEYLKKIKLLVPDEPEILNLIGLCFLNIVLITMNDCYIFNLNYI